MCGIQSEAIQNRLLAEADLTLQKAYEVAHGIEAASKQASELRASSRTQEVHSIASGDTKQCYRCGRTAQQKLVCCFDTHSLVIRLSPKLTHHAHVSLCYVLF